MREPARLQAAIEIVDAIIRSVREEGAPADAIIRDYFRERRYAGSKDRRAVRDYVYAMVRRSGDMPESGRAAAIGLVHDDAALAALFDGSEHGPAPIEDGEPVAERSLVPAWIEPHLSPLIDASEREALLGRAPVDIRVNAAKTSREALAEAIGGEATPHSPWGLRFEGDTRLDQTREWREGLFEVQDEASQMAVLACDVRDGEQVLDLCAGAGGKALGLAAMAPGARIIASDADKRRLGNLPPRAERAGASIETLLLNPPRETDTLAQFEAGLDCVLVDAPCSGSGTWRRSPELRWRLSGERLARFVETQGRLLDLAAPLVKPGGRLVYAVCSVLPDEGAGQVAAFLSRYSGWHAQDRLEVGRRSGEGRLLSPAHDGTDGFFVAVLTKA